MDTFVFLVHVLNDHILGGGGKKTTLKATTLYLSYRCFFFFSFSFLFLKKRERSGQGTRTPPPTLSKKKKTLQSWAFAIFSQLKATVLQQNNKRSLVKEYTAWQRKPIQIHDIIFRTSRRMRRGGRSDIWVRRKAKKGKKQKQTSTQVKCDPTFKLWALWRQSGQAAAGLQ